MKKYETFYSLEGKSAHIWASKKVRCSEGPFEVVIKFRLETAGPWFYHIPQKKFRSILHVIAYILKNLENTGVQFQIRLAPDSKKDKKY